MIITVSRFTTGEHGTFSLVFVDNIFFSFGLEPQQAVIPVGTWPLIPVTSPTWTPIFKQHGMYGAALWIAWKVENPKSADYESTANANCHALFHGGDTVADTIQCIILDWCMDARTGITGKSMLTVKDFYARILPAAQRGEVQIEITNLK